MLNHVGNRGHQVKKQIRKNAESFWKYQGKFSCFTHGDRDDCIHPAAVTTDLLHQHDVHMRWPSTYKAHLQEILQLKTFSAVYFSLGHIAMTFLEEIPKIPLFPRVLSIWQRKSPCRLALPVLEISLWVGVFFLKIWRTAAAKVSIAFILCSWYWYSHYITAVPHMTTRSKIMYKSQHVW